MEPVHIAIGFMLLAGALAVSSSSGSGDGGPDFPDPIGELAWEGYDDIEAQPELDGVVRVNTHRDGDGIYVPEVWMMASDRDAAWEYIARCAFELEHAFSDHHVRHFEFHCMSEEGDVYCHKTCIAPADAETMTKHAGYTERDLAADTQAGDNGDDGTPPVHWQPCDEHEEPSDVSGGGAVAASAGAAAAAGGCAGGAGGAC